MSNYQQLTTKGTSPSNGKVPSRPWKVLEMDIVMHNNKWYLLVVDYSSKFPYTLFLFFQYLVLQRKSSVTMQQTSLSENTRNLLPTRDSSWLQQSSTTKGVIASLRGRCRPSRSCLPGVIKIIPTTIWLSKSFGQPPSTAIYSHQQSFSSTDSWKLHFHPSSGLHTTMKLSENPSKPDRITAEYNAHSKEKPDLLPTQPIWVQDAISKRWKPRCGQSPSGDTPLLHHPDTTRWIQQKEVAIPTTVPRPVNTTYQY